MYFELFKRSLAVLLFSVTVFLQPSVSRAQSLPFPLPEGIGLDIKAASYGAEIYVPISVGDQWDVGLQYTQIWNEAYFNNMPELQNTGLKARYFFSPSKAGHYIGLLIAANGFEDASEGGTVEYTPVLGASYGYEWPLLGNWMKIGVELEGGFGTGWKGYAGAGFSLGFYYY